MSGGSGLLHKVQGSLPPRLGNCPLPTHYLKADNAQSNYHWSGTGEGGTNKGYQHPDTYPWLFHAHTDTHTLNILLGVTDEGDGRSSLCVMNVERETAGVPMVREMAGFPAHGMGECVRSVGGFKREVADGVDVILFVGDESREDDSDSSFCEVDEV